ncbi:hypothetical protein [Rhizobium paknamense]|uniref:Uncharacterized protein n=1 Tax=Rhizobium paknamense TaxID=1206817 RepID=A0ABU0I994_9HYPH|nr:hypothetical protein [Rhizobium paknamense]MDQ0454252.1 hypothetical protein [Rhizobium paknamense]
MKAEKPQFIKLGPDATGQLFCRGKDASVMAMAAVRPGKAEIFKVAVQRIAIAAHRPGS